MAFGRDAGAGLPGRSWGLGACDAKRHRRPTAPTPSLQRYASIRAPRTAAIQLGSRANANGFYSPDGDLATIKAAALQLTGQVDANYRKVYGHKVEEDLHTA